MIKLRKDNIIVLGLSDENMKRLADNQPIKFKMSELILGSNLEVFIFNGKDEETMKQMFLDQIGPATIVKGL